MVPIHKTVTAKNHPAKTALGVLRGRITLTLQTHPALRLVHGRRGSEGVPPILGLLGFAEKLKILWQGAKAEDPYAHWWLWEVEQSLKQTRDLIRQAHEAVTRRLQQDCALDIGDVAATHPEQIVLQFANPYAFLGAQMLAEYDRLVCGQRTLIHIGLACTPEQAQDVGRCERSIRATFLVPQRYRFLGIDKIAVEHNTAPAQQAQALMGVIPEAILNGQQRALLAPLSRTARQTRTDSRTATRQDSVAEKPMPPDTTLPKSE